MNFVGVTLRTYLHFIWRLGRFSFWPSKSSVGRLVVATLQWIRVATISITSRIDDTFSTFFPYDDRPETRRDGPLSRGLTVASRRTPPLI